MLSQDTANIKAAWLANKSKCGICGYPVVVTQATEDCCDYWWYCANKQCERHHPGEQTGDMEVPDWVKDGPYGWHAY